ncbi:MAG: sulfatase [Verrucomicrobiota bacterium]
MMSTISKLTLRTACFVVFLLCIVLSFNVRADEKTNVLFITADDLNTALSGFGHPQCKTPNLDKLASHGVTFIRAYCQFPLCGPSRASIFSGQYPVKNGVMTLRKPLKQDTLTLPRYFKEEGYWTARVSKLYHMDVPGAILRGDDGTDHYPSWTERFNSRAMETLTPGSYVRNHVLPNTIESYPEWRDKWHNNWVPGDVKKIPGGHLWVTVEANGDRRLLPDDQSADKAIELLRKRAEDKKPFFLGVGFVRPHYPFVAPVSDFDAYIAAEMTLPQVPDNHFEGIPSQAQGKDLKIDDAERRSIRRSYYACISYMDRQVGRVLDELDKLGLRENTIVVFLSDHGYLLGEHKLWKKNRLWEESVRSPLIISAPGMKLKGVQYDQPVELLDVYPTVLELAGLKPLEHLQGYSLAKLLTDPEAQTQRKDAYSMIRNGHLLRSEKWAYMWYPKLKKLPEGFMLYDMEKDPEQHSNLANNPEFKNIKEKLHTRLMQRIEYSKN